METGQRAKYDLIITDPPSLAKRESERAAALKKYESLNMAAFRRLTREGILVAASCSSHVKTDEFCSTILSAGKKCGLRFQELWRSGPPLDHPATFPEANYLKAICLELR
jgi:23S rRNA (cytosine1962-C5)-methyltransferase